jgi:hypothetical protein
MNRDNDTIDRVRPTAPGRVFGINDQLPLSGLPSRFDLLAEWLSAAKRLGRP